MARQMVGKTLRFEAELDLQMVGTYRYHAIKLPGEVQSQIEFVSGVKQRFEGNVNGEGFAGALLPTGTGGYYMMVNGALRKKLKLELGDSLSVTITIVDPNKVDVPEDVIRALSADEETLFKWDVLTAGTKRGILHQINSARSEALRADRIASLVQRMRQSQPFEPFSMRNRL